MTTLPSIREALRALDRDEGGAIFLAALAATLILLMLSLVLYETGNVSREKVKLQTATDSAAYSQAAIKARSMNINAYTNVAKRSIVGIHLTYHASFSYFYRVVGYSAQACTRDPTNPDQQLCQAAFQSSCASTCQNPGDCGPGFTCQSGQCRNSAGQLPSAATTGCDDTSNWSIAHGESTRDWDDLQDPGVSTNNLSYGGFAGVWDDPPQREVKVGVFRTQVSDGGKISSISGNNNQVALEKFNKELLQLSRYQELIQRVTPWWSFAEAISRGTHNGATMVTSFPPPPEPNHSASLTSELDGLVPTTPLMEDWSWEIGGQEVGLAGPLDIINGEEPGATLCERLRVLDPSRAEMPIFFDSSWASVNLYDGEDPGLTREMAFNTALNYANSDEPPVTSVTAADGSTISLNLAKEHSKAALFPTEPGAIIGGYDLCMLSHSEELGSQFGADRYQASNVDVLDAELTSPYVVTAERSTALGQMRMSNILFGYRYGKDLGDESGPDEQGGRANYAFLSQDYANRDNVHFQGRTGMWALARSEVVPIGGQNGNWHTNWTARIRPMALHIGDFSEFEEVLREMSATETGNFLERAWNSSAQFYEVNYDLVHSSSGLDLDVVDEEFKAMSRFMSEITENPNGTRGLSK